VATPQIASKRQSYPDIPVSAKAHRLRSGVSIDSICERTKISRYFLEAIEERAYHLLPGGIFDVNYIRQYSESVGCSADLLLADYRSVSQRSGPGREGAAAARRTSRSWWRSLLLHINV